MSYWEKYNISKGQEAPPETKAKKIISKMKKLFQAIPNQTRFLLEKNITSCEKH